MKKRAIKFSTFFVMMLIFAIIEDMLAASFSGAVFLLETIPIIFIIALIFTFLTELVEEHFEYGKQPLEKIIDKTFEYLEKEKINLTHENVKKHLKRHAKIHTENIIYRTFDYLEKENIKPTHENVKKHMKRYARIHRS